MKKIVAIFISVLIVQTLLGQQDIHFSQFFNSSVSLNPAEAGMANADLRLLANYRSQWTSINSPYKTKSFSIDAGLMERKLVTEYMGMGLDFFQDGSSDTHISTFGVNSHFSYITQLDRKSKLSFGLKIGFLQRNINYRGLLWPNQFDGQDFDLNIPSGINFGLDQVSAVDLGTGIYYKTNPMKGKEVYVGLSADHLTSPNVAFLGKEDKYLRKYTLKTGAELSKRNSAMSILPSLIAMFQGKNRYIIFGSDVRYVISKGSRTTGINKAVAFQGGGFFRLRDAFYAHAGISYGDYSVSVSYDITLSDLTLAAGPTGALEIMLIYTPAFSEFAKRKRSMNR